MACAVRTICSPEFLQLESERCNGKVDNVAKCLPYNDGGKLIELVVSAFEQLISDDVLVEAGTQGAEVAFFLNSMFFAFCDLDDFATACDTLNPEHSASVAWDVFDKLIIFVFDFMGCDQPDQHCPCHARGVRQCAKFVLALLRQFRGGDMMPQRLMNEHACLVQKISLFTTQCADSHAKQSAIEFVLTVANEIHVRHAAALTCDDKAQQTLWSLDVADMIIDLLHLEAEATCTVKNILAAKKRKSSKLASLAIKLSRQSNESGTTISSFETTNIMLVPSRLTFSGSITSHQHQSQNKLSEWIDVVDGGLVLSRAEFKADDGTKEDPNTCFISFNAVENIVVTSRARIIQLCLKDDGTYSWLWRHEEHTPQQQDKGISFQFQSSALSMEFCHDIAPYLIDVPKTEKSHSTDIEPLQSLVLALDTSGDDFDADDGAEGSSKPRFAPLRVSQECLSQEPTQVATGTSPAKSVKSSVAVTWRLRCEPQREQCNEDMNDGGATEVIEPASKEMSHSDANPSDHDSMADEVEWNDQQSEHSHEGSANDANGAHEIGKIDCNVKGARDEFDEQQLGESDIKTMRVPELRKALEVRALDSTGKKAELQARLRSAIEECYEIRIQKFPEHEEIEDKQREEQMSDNHNNTPAPRTTDLSPSTSPSKKRSLQTKLSSSKQRRILRRRRRTSGHDDQFAFEDDTSLVAKVSSESRIKDSPDDEGTTAANRTNSSGKSRIRRKTANPEFDFSDDKEVGTTNYAEGQSSDDEDNSPIMTSAHKCAKVPKRSPRVIVDDESDDDGDSVPRQSDSIDASQYRSPKYRRQCSKVMSYAESEQSQTMECSADTKFSSVTATKSVCVLPAEESDNINDVNFAALNVEAVDAMTCKQLKDYLKEAGAKTSGKKADLRKRLLAFLSAASVDVKPKHNESEHNLNEEFDNVSEQCDGGAGSKINFGPNEEDNESVENEGTRSNVQPDSPSFTTTSPRMDLNYEFEMAAENDDEEHSTGEIKVTVEDDDKHSMNDAISELVADHDDEQSIEGESNSSFRGLIAQLEARYHETSHPSEPFFSKDEIKADADDILSEMSREDSMLKEETPVRPPDISSRSTMTDSDHIFRAEQQRDFKQIQRLVQKMYEKSIKYQRDKIRQVEAENLAKHSAKVEALHEQLSDRKRKREAVVEAGRKKLSDDILSHFNDVQARVCKLDCEISDLHDRHSSIVSKARRLTSAITASQALRKNLKAFVNEEESEYVRISSRHYQQAVEQLKKKDAGLDLTEALRSILTGRL
eukprot:g1782.t1